MRTRLLSWRCVSDYIRLVLQADVGMQYMKRLREDLDKVRILADICRRREVRKLDQQQIIQDVFSRALFSNEPTLRMTFEKIRG